MLQALSSTFDVLSLVNKFIFATLRMDYKLSLCLFRKYLSEQKQASSHSVEEDMALEFSVSYRALLFLPEVKNRKTLK
jgi:hypothetical protein